MFERCGLAEVRVGGHRAGSGFGEGTVVGREPGGHHEASDGASSEARRCERGLIAAPVADPPVWFVRELLHCCRGKR